MGLFGKDLSFYLLLEQQAQKAVEAAAAFHALSKDFSTLDTAVVHIKQIETAADDLTHQLYNKVDSTFVTPLDKEDLYALSGRLDDITDTIEATAIRISIYRLKECRPDLESMVFKLVATVQATLEAIMCLKDMHNRTAMHNALVRVHQLENESDESFRAALSELFSPEAPDPIYVMKWKEVYDRVEIAVDKCEDVANIVESVVVKYA
ncbi:MAG: DUF47 family protein [Chthonomonadales bacterium]